MTSRRPSTRSGWLAGLLLAAASSLATLLVLEGGLRLAVPHWAGLVPQRFMTMTPDGVLGGVPWFEGRVASLGREFDVPVRLDGRGFPNPPEASPSAPLAFIGDSFCFGWGVEPEQAYPRLVATRLGMPAYSFCSVAADLRDDAEILRRWMPRGRRGTTILSITFENDVLGYPDPTEDAAASSSVRGLSRSPVSRWLMHHSALFNVVTSIIRQNATIVAFVRRLGLVSGVPVVATGIDPIAASVRRVGLVREAAGTGRFVVVMVPPRPGQMMAVDYGAFVAALDAAGFEVLEPVAERIPISTIPADGHWDAATHAAIADALTARLSREARD
jgi:hypothetical protein